MKKTKKASYEKILEIFEETHKLLVGKESQDKWHEGLEKNGWTDEEFDEELTKRTFEKKIA
jgi:hypothetical protein